VSLNDSDVEAGLLTRVRLDVSYDGSAFSGWAVQPGLRTVQGCLEEGLTTVLRGPASLTVAGRTDAGVHASGQVAHLDVPAAVWDQEHARLVRRLAGVLPADVRVHAATAVPPEFDARFSALWRSYEYLIDDSDGGPDPLRRASIAAWRRSLDTDRMAAAAEALVGLHDFAAFCKHRPNATTIRTVQQFSVTRDGSLVALRVRADAFCHSMVRSLVGALAAVGEGRRPVQWPAGLLNRTERANDVAVAPAEGLRLVAVGYPPPDALGSRATQTRAVRTLPTAGEPTAE